MKVYMLKHPTRQLPVGLFSDYILAMSLAERAFRSCSAGEFEHCIEEFELDPLKEKLKKNIYPWAVYVNVVNQETEITSLDTLFEVEHIDYTQGRLACAYVFALNEEEAENRALDLWNDYQAGKNAIHAISIFSVIIDENGDVVRVNKTEAFTQGEEIRTTIRPWNNNVEVRVVAETIDEALQLSRDKYDEWIDEQVAEFGDDLSD